MVFMTWQMYVATRVHACLSLSFTFGFWACSFASVNNSRRCWMVSSRSFCVSSFTSARSFLIRFLNMLLREIFTNRDPILYVFCEISIPVIVPAKPVMAAKTSLFHVCKRAKCAISMAVRLNVNVMANLTPRTRRSLGGTSSATPASILFVVFFFMRAFFIQSVNGYAPSPAVNNG